MEPHPVPKNILEVEFALFGSFTISQFSKILFGCLFALIIFFTPIPELIKFPIMGILTLIGLLTALVPRLEVKLWAFLKNIFISPRYVWIKVAKAPEILTREDISNIEERQNVSKSTVNNKVKLDEISLSQVFGRDNSVNDADNSLGLSNKPRLDYEDEQLLKPRGRVREDNLDMLYEKIYKHNLDRRNSIQNIQKTPIQTQSEKVNTQSIKTQKNSIDLNNPIELQKEIDRLKAELTKVVKDQNYRENEGEIMYQINELYNALKTIQNNNEVSNNLVGEVRNFKGERLDHSQSVFGIIVSKQGVPISDAQIQFINEKNGNTISSQSEISGRFITGEKLFTGTYTVKLAHPDYRFNSYRIEVGEQKLPAYKFRAK